MILQSEMDGIRVTWTELSKELKRTSALWRRNAQNALKRQDRNASKALYHSMKTRLNVDELGNPGASITPSVPYWEYVDLGVKGAKKSPFPRQRKSPFRYRTKQPPIQPLVDWAKTRGITPRDEKGRFMSFQQFGFMVSRTIWYRGLKPSYFLTDTGKYIEEKYTETLATAFATDLTNAIWPRDEKGRFTKRT